MTNQINIYPAGSTYLNAEGVYELCDTNIVENTNPLNPEYQYAVEKNNLKYRFMSDPTQKDFVQIIYKDLDGDGIEDVVSYSITGLFLYNEVTGESVLVDSPKNIAPIVNENEITYPGIFSGVDLSFSAEQSKLKENIILHEELVAIIPDPFAIGHAPENCKLVMAMKISFNGILLEVDNQFINLQNMDGKVNLFIEPVVAKSKTGYILTQYLFQKLNINTGDFLYGVTYNTTQRATYPIEIDPTISLLSASGDVGYSQYSSVGGSTSGTSEGRVGYTSTDDGKGTITTIYYRGHVRYNLSTVSGHTIYEQSGSNAVAKIYWTVTYPVGVVVWSLINDPGLLDSGDYYATPLTTVQSIQPVLGWQNSLPIKNHIISKKNTGTKYIAFQLRHGWGDTNPNYLNRFAGSGANAPTLSFLAYSTFVQDALSTSGKDILVSWSKTENGLVAGDKHRIYYAPGYGLTASQVMEANSFIEAEFDATSTILTIANGAYSIVIVDAQLVSGTFYLGAQSNIQEITFGADATDSLSYIETTDAEFSLGTLTNVVAVNNSLELIGSPSIDTSEQAIPFQYTSSVNDALMGFPLTYYNYPDVRFQYLILNSELAAAGFYPGDIINKMTFQMSTGIPVSIMNFRIHLQNTNTYTGTTLILDGWTKVFERADISPMQLMANATLPCEFTTPFIWNGNHLLVDISKENSLTTTTTAAVLKYAGSNRASFTSGNYEIQWPYTTVGASYGASPWFPSTKIQVQRGVEYPVTGEKISPPIDLTSLGQFEVAGLNYHATTPANTAIVIEYSVDDGVTWSPMTNSTVDLFTKNSSLSGKSLLIKTKFTTSNKYLSPSLQDLNMTILGSSLPVTGMPIIRFYSNGNVGIKGSLITGQPFGFTPEGNLNVNTLTENAAIESIYSLDTNGNLKIKGSLLQGQVLV